MHERLTGWQISLSPSNREQRLAGTSDAQNGKYEWKESKAEVALPIDALMVSVQRFKNSTRVLVKSNQSPV